MGFHTFQFQRKTVDRPTSHQYFLVYVGVVGRLLMCLHDSQKAKIYLVRYFTICIKPVTFMDMVVMDGIDSSMVQGYLNYCN